MGVNRYEVEMRVHAGKGFRLVTRVEHAYSVTDAILQAGMNHIAEHPGESVEKLVHVGPPSDAIEPPPQIRIALDPRLKEAAAHLGEMSTKGNEG